MLQMNVFAQKNNNKEIESLKYVATNYFKKGMYDEALPNYIRITELQPENNMAFLDAGICHLYSSKPKKDAIGILKNSLRNVANGVDQYYYLARAYHLSGDYEKAITTYKIFLARYTYQDNWRENVILNIKQAYNALLQSKKNEAQLSVENVGDSINTLSDEFAYHLVQAKQQLVFSRSNAHQGYDNLFYNSGNYFIKNATTKLAKNRSGYWAENVFDSTLLSNRNYVTSKANYMFHWVTQYASDNDYNVNLVRFKNNLIDSVFLSKIINSKYSDKDAFYCAADSSVYFSSNRPGGYGGYDIYYTKWNAQDSTWTKPANLGHKVNTPFDEVTPFIRDGKILFFASNCDKSIGGFDIFSFNKKDLNANNAINVGFPINSAFNEEKYSLSDDGFTAYFISDRDGGMGYKDIYAAYYIIPNATYKAAVLPDLTYAFKLLADRRTETSFTTNFNTNNSSGNVLAQNKTNTEKKKEEPKKETQIKDKNVTKTDPKKEDKKEPKKTEVKTETKKTENKKETKAEPKKEDKKTENKAVNQANNTSETKIVALEIHPIRMDEKGRMDKSTDALLEKIVSVLKANPNARLEVQSHAFVADDPKVNLYKSIDFCKNLREKFRTMGSSGARISYNCYGSQYPVKNVKANETEVFLNNRINLILHDLDEKQVQVSYTEDKSLKPEQKSNAYNELLQKTSEKKYKVEIILLEKTGFLNYRVGNEEVCCQILRDGKLRFLTGFYPSKEAAKEKNDYVKMKGFINSAIIPYQYGFEYEN